MDKLKEQIDRPHRPEPLLNMDRLAETLPEVPSSPLLKRKPVPANDVNRIHKVKGHNGVNNTSVA